MHRKRRGAQEDPKAPASLAKSRRKEKPVASRNVGLPQPSMPPPTMEAPPAPQGTHTTGTARLNRLNSSCTIHHTPKLQTSGRIHSPGLTAETGIAPAANRW